MSEKESLSMKALRIVYGDEVIVVQCVTRQVVKGRVLIKVYPDCRVVASVPPET
ncbi:metal-dependent hydrolase, partial [Escherichia coli]|nr:metal-dependent hydrolase [Escherichia coli]